MIIGWMDEQNIRMPTASECQLYYWRCSTTASHSYSHLNHTYIVRTEQTEEMSVYQAPDRKCSVAFNSHTFNLTYDTCRKVFLALGYSASQEHSSYLTEPKGLLP